MRSAVRPSIFPVLRKNTSVAPVCAKAAASSPLGMGVRPGVRVSTTLWLTSGQVSSQPRAAAAPKTLLTPGTMREATPFSARALICSLIAPYIAGSAVCRRTTRLPARAASLMAATCSPRFMEALSLHSQPGLQRLRCPGLTSDPAYTTRSACSSAFRPRRVMRSSAPGPAPTNSTKGVFMALSLSGM